MGAFFDDAVHPTLNRPNTACGYAPMVELPGYLESHGFVNYIVSGGGRDFMRPVTAGMYGIPPERVIGSSVGLDFTDGHLVTIVNWAVAAKTALGRESPRSALR